MALWAFALLSVAANVAHTIQIFTPQTTLINAVVGIGITASAPIAVVLASEEVARLAFQRPRKKK
jgi:steroid 5-alpha reductase family enzyme